MTVSMTHELQPAWNLAGAQVQAKALEIALQERLFEHFIEPQTVANISSKLALTFSKASAWLELLWSMGYLEKTNENLFRNSSIAQRYLLADTAQSCAQAVLFRLQTLRKFSEEFDSILKDQEPVSPVGDMGAAWAKAATAQIFEEQRAVTVPALEHILSRFPELAFESTARPHFLDLGAGAGLISIALMQRFQQATGVAFDFPATVDVAKQHITEAGLNTRLSIQSGNLNTDYPTGQFDLIWCSSVLHFLERPALLLQRIAASLVPSGYLLLLHAEQAPEPQRSRQVLPFYTPMVMRGSYLPKVTDLPQQLAALGLNVLQSEWVESFPMAPVKLYLCRKEA